ncbi:MAG: carboxypeptidase-like regulatory domain-containing protein [Flavobacterium sp.]|nr:carboxypeptidase-like regulatory domain-containing protein [Flavobacterium sp.]
MKKIILLLIILFSNVNFAQIKGSINDQKNNALPFVNVFIENTYNSTTANEKGKYNLNFNKKGDYVLVFQYLGYRTEKKSISIDHFPFELNVILEEENYRLNEVVINKKDNPAIAIIKNAIVNRKENSDKTARYTADFYSRGMLKLKNLPKKILGQKIDLDLETASNLDSTGSGTIYLSETVSKISFQKPNDLSERIIASKIAGNDKGFSNNSARSSKYDFYDDYLKFNLNLVSPIAKNAFNYYKYKLESSFFDSNNHLINKIKVIPRRDKEPVFEGYIYIVDGSWAIYAVDVDIKGYRMKVEFIENMNLKQNFNFNAKSNVWAKNSQILNFISGVFGIKYLGNFNYIFSNYEFKDAFDKKTFGNEIISFEPNANKKANDYWATKRPIPLTDEETDNYIRKEKLQIRRNSKSFQDSIDAMKNKFRFDKVLIGYKFQNTFKKYSLAYDGVTNLSRINFNTVQGYNLTSNFTFKKWNDEQDEGKFSSIKTIFNYGFDEKRFRVLAVYNRRFNSQNYADLTISGGTKVNQFNDSPPISNLINTVSTLFFKDNYMKLYNLEFAEIKYSQDVANGVNMVSKLAYFQRKPLFNGTDYSYFNRQDIYLSNNPINENDFTNASFDKNNLMKFNLDFKINFGNKYISRPDEKINIRNRKFPTLYIGLEKTFATSEKKYEYAFFNSSVFYDLGLENKGKLGINLKAGKFINANNIAFMDYKHFNGNQTHFGSSNRYLNVFNFMPYYSNSTNDKYLEIHSEYDDNGFIMNKLPIFNLLKSNLMFGFHNLAIPGRKPYSEITIGLDNLGFGKFKLFRLDYIRSYQNGYQGDGIIFGCKILNILE